MATVKIITQEDPHKVDNSFLTRWQEGPSLVEARSAHTSFVTSQVGTLAVILCVVQTMFMHSFLLCTCAIDVVSMWMRFLH